MLHKIFRLMLVIFLTTIMLPIVFIYSAFKGVVDFIDVQMGDLM